MDYIAGLEKLRMRLEEWNDKEVIHELDRLESTLRRSERGHIESTEGLADIICQLDKLAYRNIGTSFKSLCSPSPFTFSRPMSHFTLKRVFNLILICMFLPGLILAIVAGVMQATASQIQEQADLKIQEIDARLLNGITSHFYLSRANPCADDTTKQIQTSDILFEMIDHCIWEYKDPETRQVIAIDTWDYQRKNLPGSFGFTAVIAMREYFADSNLVARDHFSLNENECFRRREYFDDEGDIVRVQCFSEAGKALNEERTRANAPIPPIFYWFMYR